MVMCEKIFLKKSIVEDKNISSEGIMVYVGLTIASENKIDRLFTTIGAIQLMLKSSFDNDRYFRDKVKRGLINLKENNIIDVHSESEDFKNNEPIIVQLNNFRIDTKKDKFIIVNVNEINKILSYQEKKFEHEKLLKYFLAIVGTINNNSKVGFTTLDVLSEMANVNVTTATVKYNSVLEELELIYIHRHNSSHKCFDGTIRKINNTYGRYKDKNEIIKNAVGYIKEVLNVENYNCIDGDEARSIKQKYNHFIKKINNGYNPSDEEVSEMEDKIKLYNNRYRNTEEIIKLNSIATYL